MILNVSTQTFPLALQFISTDIVPIPEYDVIDTAVSMLCTHRINNTTHPKYKDLNKYIPSTKI